MPNPNHGGKRLGSGRPPTGIETTVISAGGWFKQPIKEYLANGSYEFKLCDYLNDISKKSVKVKHPVTLRVPLAEVDNIKQFISKGKETYVMFMGIESSFSSISSAIGLFNLCHTTEQFVRLSPYPLNSKLLLTVTKPITKIVLQK